MSRGVTYLLKVHGPYTPKDFADAVLAAHDIPLHERKRILAVAKLMFSGKGLAISMFGIVMGYINVIPRKHRIKLRYWIDL